MARQQVVSTRGDVDNQAPGMYRGKLEELMGCFRVIEANFVELYGDGSSAVGPQGPAGATGPSGPAGPAGADGASATGVLVTDASPGSGALTAYTPSGFGATTSRLDIAADNADTTINDLPAGFDDQRLRIRNTGGTGTLTLTNANAGSTAAKRFSGVNDVALPPGESIEVRYYAGSVNRWIM